MIAFSVHLAPNAPWATLLAASLGLALLALWSYRFALPPLPVLARRILPAIRLLCLVALAWLLAQPVLEKDRAGRGIRIALLRDRSWSMDLASAGAGSPTRAAVAEQAIQELRRGLRGRASVVELPFAGRLGADTTWRATRGATALGSALAELPRAPEGQSLDGVVVVSDGIVNAGEDPVAAARALGVPVHAVAVGRAGGRDRAVIDVESSASARVGEPTPVRVRIAGEGGGDPIAVRLLDGNRELARATVPAPSGGAEATAELRVTPTRPGLAVWTAAIDSLAGETTTRNNARQVAVEVSPSRLGVLILSAELNWDLAFLRRALAGDSSLALDARVRERAGWRGLDQPRAGAPTASDLRGKAVVILDGVTAAEAGPEFDAALTAFVRGGGGLLAFGGAPPGLRRYRAGRLGAELGVTDDPSIVRAASPLPTVEGRELLAWDEDPARGERAWRTAAPLSDVAAFRPAGGDRPLLAAADGGPPIMTARRIGRGQALLVNGTGFWRWSLSGLDEFAGERGRRLWRRLVRWLAEPVQGEPLRVRPERWLTARGEPLRLLASLQDRDFKPLAGAAVEGEVQDEQGRRTPVRFEPRERGSYVTTLEDLPPGRYRIAARASRAGQDLGAATSEFAVDRWSLEEARAEPDSAALAAMAAAGGGRVTTPARVEPWARTLPARALAARRSETIRLWESPWVFAIVVGMLGVEWAWRRRRGLP